MPSSDRPDPVAEYCCSYCGKPCQKPFPGDPSVCDDEECTRRTAMSSEVPEWAVKAGMEWVEEKFKAWGAGPSLTLEEAKVYARNAYLAGFSSHLPGAREGEAVMFSTGKCALHGTDLTSAGKCWLCESQGVEPVIRPSVPVVVPCSSCARVASAPPGKEGG